jgi:hypothetical protein
VVGAWKSPKPRRGGVVARDGGCGQGRDKKAHRDINIDQGVRVEDCATTEKMIFIPTLKPLAQGGVRFSDFHAPPCADFCTYLSAIDFGALLAH